MLSGSIWMILLRWTIRLIGLLSTVILARLLTPADFGVVAIAMVVVGLLEVLNQTGQMLALIRMAQPSREDYDTAWTISFLGGLSIAVLILLIAPFSQAYFNEPRAVAVMQCLALRAAIGGFSNIGIVDFRKSIRFDLYFRYNAYSKVVSFFVTLGSALYFRNYWALVAGTLVGQVSAVVFSYTMHPYRPRPSLARMSSLFSFSMWTLVKSIGTYLNQRIDKVVIGGIAGTSSMGRYAVADDLACSPIYEVNDPMVAVLYPVMSRFRANKASLQNLYLKALGWSAIICASGSVGVALVAPEMVQLVLGPKWLSVIPLMSWLALSAGVLGFGSGAYTLFDLTGHPHIGARMQWLRLAFLVAAIVPVGIITHSLVAIAETRLIATVLFIPTLLTAAGRQIDLSAAAVFAVIWRPLSSTGAMAIVVINANSFIGVSGVEKLIMDVVIGASTFCISIMALWFASGRPESVERDIVHWIRTFLPFSRLRPKRY